MASTCIRISILSSRSTNVSIPNPSCPNFLKTLKLFLESPSLKTSPKCLLSALFYSMPLSRSVPRRRAFPKCVLSASANLDLPLPFGPTRKLVAPIWSVRKALPTHGTGKSNDSFLLIILSPPYCGREVLPLPCSLSSLDRPRATESESVENK